MKKCALLMTLGLMASGSALATEGSPFGGLAGDGAPVIVGKDGNPFSGVGNDGSPIVGVGNDGSPIAGVGNDGSPLGGFGSVFPGIIIPGFFGPIGGGILPLPMPGKP